MGQIWSLVLLCTAFVVLLLTAWGLARARLGSSESKRSNELSAEPFAGNLKSFWLITWLPGRYSPRGVLYGLFLACLSYIPSFSSSRWISIAGLLIMAFAMDYSIEGIWLAIQKRKIARCSIGVFGLLLALASLALNVGILADHRISLAQILE